MQPCRTEFSHSKSETVLLQKRCRERLVILQAGRLLVFILVILKCHFAINLKKYLDSFRLVILMEIPVGKELSLYHLCTLLLTKMLLISGDISHFQWSQK